MLPRTTTVGKRRRMGRLVLLAGCGGCLFQLSGCLAGLVPTALNYGEMTILARLFGGFFGG